MTAAWPVAGSDAKEWARTGIVGQWVCPLGSATEDDQVDEEGMRIVVDHVLKLNIGGLAYSSLHEVWSATHDERRRGCEVLIDAVNGRVPVYVNPTDHSIKETVRLGRHAFEHGAALLMIDCPYEHAKSVDSVMAFFQYVCERVEGPVALYNTPHSGIVLSPDELAKLCEIENVCAIKDAVDDFDHTAALFRLVGTSVVVSNPSERYYLRHIVEHEQQALLATTATHLMQSPEWQPIHEYSTAARGGEFGRAEAIYAEIQPLRDIWTSLYWVLWNDGPAQHPIAATKYWQDLMGMPAGPPRPPVPPLTAEQKEDLLKRLQGTGFAARLGIRDTSDS